MNEEKLKKFEKKNSKFKDAIIKIKSLDLSKTWIFQFPAQ